MRGNNGGGNPYEANMQARAAVVRHSIEMTQPIYSATLAGSAIGQVVNIPVRNVGLLKRFIVRITGTFTAGAAETLTQSPHGIANLLSNVTLTDYANQVRVNTSGWHLHALASARRRRTYTAGYVNDTPNDYDNNWAVSSCPATIAPTVASPFRWWYEIPCCYADDDLRGVIYAGTVSATANLQLTFNTAAILGSGSDPTLAVYGSNLASALGTLTAVQITVYQVYLDQIPVSEQGNLVLPALDLSQAYLIQNTVMSAIVPNQDNAIPYTNFREFLSTFAIFTQGTAGLNTAYGTDVNRWKLRSANFTNIWEKDPYLVALENRRVFMNDLPRGTYYFESRAMPINTIQYGNQELVINPIAALGTSAVYVGYESMANINQVTVAGSLPNT